jgi:hypothetical protein
MGRPSGECRLNKLVPEAPPATAVKHDTFANGYHTTSNPPLKGGRAPDFPASLSAGLFATMTKRRLKRSIFRFVVDIRSVINCFIREVSECPRPFTWTADPDKVIAALRRGHQVLD